MSIVGSSGLRTHHHILDSAFNCAAVFLVPGPGSRFTPIANAVRTAKPVYMYDPRSVSDYGLIHGGYMLTMWVEFILANLCLHLGLAICSYLYQGLIHTSIKKHCAISRLVMSPREWQHDQERSKNLRDHWRLVRPSIGSSPRTPTIAPSERTL
jgi:hypothetical protein